MSCTRVVRIIRSSSGTCSTMYPIWLSDCQRTFTPLTYIGSPKLLVAKNRRRLRFLSSPAPMASLYVFSEILQARALFLKTDITVYSHSTEIIARFLYTQKMKLVKYILIFIKCHKNVTFLVHSLVFFLFLSLDFILRRNSV